jgi:hypothetical protein
MSIDPRRLRAALQLVTGAAPAADDANGLARRLGVVEEVLPWLVLRRDALADMPALTDILATAVKRCPSPTTRHQLTRVGSPTRLAAERRIEEALGALIADNIAHADVAMAAEAQIARLTRMSESQHAPTDIPYRIPV